MVVPHKKNIPGVRRQLKSIANKSLSWYLLADFQTNKEPASVAPARGLVSSEAEGNRPKKAAPETR